MSSAASPANDPGPAALYDIEVEQAVIGAVMVDNRHYVTAAVSLKAEDFFDPLHSRLWEEIEREINLDMVVTPLTLHAAMKMDPGLSEVGGTVYLAGCAQAAPSLPPMRDYARILHDLGTRRRALAAIDDAVAQIKEPNIPVVQALSSVVVVADRAAVEQDARRGSAEAGDAAYALMRELENRESLGPVGITSGIQKLDDLLGSFYPENLIILAGRPGMGKSTLGPNIARSAAKHGHQVEYFSLEMSKRELSARFISDIDFSKLRDITTRPLHYSRLLKRKITDQEFERATHAARDLKDLPIAIHDRDRMTMAEIAAVARSRASQAEGRKGIVIIDHLHIVDATERYKGSRVNEIAEMTGLAKGLAKSIKWPVLLLSQLSREIERRPEKDRMPLLSDLRESGSIEQDADVVIGMLRIAHYIKHRKPALGDHDPEFGKWLAEYEPVKNRLELGVIKNRHGATDTIKCFVDIAAGAIRDEDPFNGVSPDVEDLLS